MNVSAGFVNARLKIALLVGVFLVAILALPALASAETWVGDYPAGVIHTQPSAVGVDVFAASALDARTAVVTIAGVRQKAFVTQGAASGSWTSVDTLVNGVWKTTWTWTPASGGSSKATVYCYPAALTEGAKAVVVTIKDVNGVSMTHSWSFTVAVPPAFGSPIPAAGSRVKTPTPTISVPVSDNTGVTSVSATVNGAPVTATLLSGKVTVTGFVPTADGPVTVAVTAADAAGNSSTKTWTFALSYFTNQTCVAPACHGTVYNNDPAMGTDCILCHPDASHGTAHEASPAPATISISGVSFGSHACSECHATNLVNEHANVCATCHPSPKDTVAGTWAKGCVQGGCHTAGSTKPMHASIDAAHVFPANKAACLASGCHDAGAITPFAGKSLGQLHASATTTTAGGATRTSCQICHAAGVTPTDNCTSAGCHPGRAVEHGYDAAKHTGTPTSSAFVISGVTYPAVACSSCHSLELGVEHTKASSVGNTGCAECHSGRVAQLPPPWNKNTCAQGNCHAGTSPEPTHSTITTDHARLTSVSDNACFAAGCHADGNLAALHSQATTTVAGVVRTSCMVCHAAGVPATKDCTVCHADKVASHYKASQHTATFTSENFNIGGYDLGSHDCAECHATNELAPAHAGQSCSLCHPTAAASTKPWNKSCATAACHTSGPNAQHAQVESAHSVSAQSCTDSCHAGAGNIAAIHGSDGCSKCHASGQTPTTDCSTCHDLDNPHDLPSIHAADLSLQSMVFFEDSTDHANEQSTGRVEVYTDCTMCHNPNLIVQHQDLPCATCHEGDNPVASLNGEWNGSCQQGDCHPGDIHATASDGHGNQAYAEGCASCHDYVDQDGPNSSREWCGQCHGRPRDLEPPVTTSDAVDTYSGSATITMSATDVDGWIRFQCYRLDGGDPVVIEGNSDPSLQTVDVTDTGTHTLEFWAIDGPYHEEEHQTVEFTVQ